MKKSVVWLTEGAVCVAISVVLSLISVIKMPFGGSVTAASMLPVIIVSYRYGFKKGLICGFVFSLIQLITDIGTLSFATSYIAVITIIFLDYLIAFSSVAAAGFFKNRMKSRRTEIIFAILSVMLIRFVCHVISGCTVWAGVSIPSRDGLIFSMVYNAAFMLPEAIIHLAAGVYLFSIIDFSADRLKSVNSGDDKLNGIITAAAYFILVGAGVFDAVKLFMLVETESGFTANNLTINNLSSIIIVTALAVVFSVILLCFAKYRKNWLKHTK